LLDQIRAIDNVRLIDGALTTLTDDELTNVYSAVNEIMGK